MSEPAVRKHARYDRFVVRPGVHAWVYEYWNARPIRHGGVASGLELGVQLDGEWWHAGMRSPARTYTRGEIHRILPAEPYEMAFEARDRAGLQVGFAIYPHEIPRFESLDGELVLTRDAGVRDARFVEACRLVADLMPDEHGVPPCAEIDAELCAYIERHAELVPIDPLVLAKREIERHFAAELYIEHLAEVARMHPETFTRKFLRRFGITPIRYRLQCRLNRASASTWACPDLSVEQIAEMCGFHDMPYFHRVFRARFGTTPAAYGHRESARAHVSRRAA